MKYSVWACFSDVDLDWWIHMGSYDLELAQGVAGKAFHHDGAYTVTLIPHVHVDY